MPVKCVTYSSRISPAGVAAQRLASGQCTLHVAAESGWGTVFQRSGHRLHVIHSSYLADGAHAVAVDPATGRSYYPVPTAPSGRPALLICDVA
jgi:hypothetical protein